MSTEELSCIAQTCLAYVSLSFFSYPCEVVSARAFYNLRSGSYNEPRGPTGGLGVGQTLCGRAQWLEVTNDVFNGVGMSALIACHPTLGQWYDVMPLHH
jgi:hypothetical protein